MSHSPCLPGYSSYVKLPTNCCYPLHVGREERNLYDIEELIEGCRLSAKRLQLEPILYSLDHPLVGQAMKVVQLALLQIKNNRAKLERRTDKMKNRNFLFSVFDCSVLNCCKFCIVIVMLFDFKTGSLVLSWAERAIQVTNHCFG